MTSPFTREARARTRQGALLELLDKEQLPMRFTMPRPEAHARAFIQQCHLVYLALHQLERERA